MSHFYFDAEEKDTRSFELPGAKPHYNPDRPGQVDHIFLDLILDISNQSFKGTCTTTIIPVRPGIEQLTMDAVDLTIESVLVESILKVLTTMANKFKFICNNLLQQKRLR